MKHAHAAAHVFGMRALWILVAVITVVPSLHTARAGFITQQNLTPVYSAIPPFNANTQITINWLAPTITIFRPDLLNISTAAQEMAWNALPGSVQPGFVDSGPVQQVTLPTNPTVDVFFLDSLTFCGNEGDVVGCASGIPGVIRAAPWSFAVSSTAAAGGSGQVLEAHELGHDLGLVHCPTNCPASTGNDPLGNPIYPDLMDPILHGSTVLTLAQANIILGNISGLVQMDAQGRDFINLQAIAIVPEPNSLMIAAAGLMLLFILHRRRRPEARARFFP